MPQGTNDDLVRRDNELRATLIQKHSKLAEERVLRLWESKMKLRAAHQRMSHCVTLLSSLRRPGDAHSSNRPAATGEWL
jgi:hypothetical protein